MPENKRPYIYFPIGLALMFAAGMYIGSAVSPGSTASHSFPIQFGKFNKLNEILNYIEKEYVDTVSRSTLENKVIAQLLQELDPHSYYVSPEELAELNEPLIGNFEGIGVEFSIQKDTIVVIAPIVGGPSELLGIRAGDRIVKVDTIPVAGNGITNSRVMELLRGEKGSKVKVYIKRRGEKKPLEFTIQRDKIPIHSIDVSYMLTATTGYIKLSRFSRTTHDEFLESVATLNKEGMEELILDLRGNGGGYLDAAINLADEFLEDGKLIVYTEGKARPKRMSYATQQGGCEKTKLYVLIDEGSASASEIIAGAIQDNDRGTIIGRRSFGKGLVQEQSDWPGGSAVRLTIARYYTPTGRCIQRPYDEGTEQYYEEIYGEHADLSPPFHSDSTRTDTMVYTTPGGKKVYGGGGITPDIHIAFDTSESSMYLSELIYSGVFRNFSFDYADKHRSELSGYKDAGDFASGFQVDNLIIKELTSFAADNGIPVRQDELNKSEKQIARLLKANIARYIWHNEGYYRILNDKDLMINSSLEEIRAVAP